MPGFGNPNESIYDEDGGFLRMADDESHETRLAAEIPDLSIAWVPPLSPEKPYPVNAFDCEDIRVLDDNGTIIYSGPKYLRCRLAECRSIVTNGMVQLYGGCFCGNRRLEPAIRLTKLEREHLRQAYYPLVEWEIRLVMPQIPDDKTAWWGKADWERLHE